MHPRAPRATDDDVIKAQEAHLKDAVATVTPAIPTPRRPCKVGGGIRCRDCAGTRKRRAISHRLPRTELGTTLATIQEVRYSRPSVHMASQLGKVFSKLDRKPRWRERLPDMEIPTLVVLGRRNRFFPLGNGEALSRDIPGGATARARGGCHCVPQSGGPRGRGSDAGARAEHGAHSEQGRPMMGRREFTPQTGPWIDVGV